MPMTYRIDEDASLIFVTVRGAIAHEERVGVLRRWLTDPAFRPGLDTLFDLTEAASTPSLEELREVLAVIHEHAASIGYSRVAVVTARPITFGIARVFEALVDAEAAPLEVKVFFNRAKAWEWLRPGYPAV
jgi:hypothetical protein